MRTLHSKGKKRALKKMIKETAANSKVASIDGYEEKALIEKLLLEKFNMQEYQQKSETSLIKNLLKKNKPAKHGRY